MRVTLARNLALLLGLGALIAMAHAIAQWAGLPAIPFMVQFGILMAAIVLITLIMPISLIGPGDLRTGGRSRANFRAILTGPFADLGRPRKRPWRYLLGTPWGVLLAAFALPALFTINTGSPQALALFLWAMMSFPARYAAWEGDPIAVALERELGLTPKLRRNRQRAPILDRA